MGKTLTICVELDESTAWALAQFVKRVGWVEFRNNAVDDIEAYKMRDGIDAIQKELNSEGYSPR